MMHRLSNLTLTLLLAIAAQYLTSGALHAQPKTTPASPKPAAGGVLLEIGKEKFTINQIAEAFKKSSSRGGRTYSQLPYDSAIAFVNIYAIYRLKVQAALAAGLDKDTAVRQELVTNRMQLAAPPGGSGYLIERKVVDPGIEKLYKRRDEELRVAIIFTATRPNDPADTLRAYSKTMRMLAMLKNGTDFGKLATDSSDDGATRINNGVVQTMITGGMVIRGLEDAAYAAKAGELYPYPVKVPGGYVIVKTLERTPRYKVRAGHILFEATFTDTTAEGKVKNVQQYEKAKITLARIRNGEDFSKVASEVSDDKTTAQYGGDFMGYYTRSLGFEAKRGKLVPEFEDPMFKLKSGQVSDIVRTPFGYHIIKCFESHKPTFDEERDILRQLYRQQYLNDERPVYVKSVLVKQGLKINDATLNRLLTQVNVMASTADTTWAAKIDAGTKASPFFTFRNRTYTVGAWIDSVGARRELSAMPTNYDGITGSITMLLEQSALEEEAKNLEKDYPEFAQLMQEFHDGILAFKAEEGQVWSKVKYDSNDARSYFNANRSNFKTQPRLALTEIFIYNQKEADSMNLRVKNNQTPFDTLAAKFTQRPGFRQTGGKWKLSYAKDADIVAQVYNRLPDPKAGDIVPMFSYMGGYSIIRVDMAEPSRLMTYDEARNEVVNQYMEALQKKLTVAWVENLRAQFGVKINDKLLRASVGKSQ